MKKILMLYYEINSIYLELYNLELNGNMNSDAFRDLVSLLKEKILEEKELFDKIKGEYDYSKLDVGNLDSPYSKRFADYASYDYDTDVDDSEMRDRVEISYYSQIYKASSQNLFLVYLSYLQELVEMENYSFIRDKLLNYKYFNAFLFHDVESVLIDNNFNVNKINYVNIDFMASLFRNKVKNVDSIILDCYYDTIMTTIEQLLSIKDIEYGNNDKLTISLNNQCMLRAALGLISERDYESVSKYIYDYVSELTRDDNSMSLNIVNSILNERSKNKERIRRISMGF